MNLPDKIKEAAEKEYPNEFVDFRRVAFIKGASFLLPEIERRAIAYLDLIGDMGWHKNKDGTWEHPDEAGKFESTKDLVEHYKIFLKEYEKNNEI